MIPKFKYDFELCPLLKYILLSVLSIDKMWISCTQFRNNLNSVYPVLKYVVLGES